MFILNTLSYNRTLKKSNIHFKKILPLLNIEREIYVRIHNAEEVHKTVGQKSLYILKKLLTSYFNYLSWIRTYDVLLYKVSNKKKTKFNWAKGHTYVAKLNSSKRSRFSSTIGKKHKEVYSSRKYVYNKYETPLKFLELVVHIKKNQSMNIKKNKNRINYFSNIRKRILFLKNSQFFKNNHTYKALAGQVESKKEKKIKSKKYKLLDIVHTMQKPIVILKNFTTFSKLHYYNRRFDYYNDKYESNTLRFVITKMAYMKKHLVNYTFYGLAYKLSDYISDKSIHKLFFQSFLYKKLSLNNNQISKFNTMTSDELTYEQVTESAKTVLNQYISEIENNIKEKSVTEELNTNINKSKYSIITKNKASKQYYYTKNRLFPIKRSTNMNKQYTYSKTIKNTKRLLRTRKAITLIQKTHNFFKELLNKFEKNDYIVSVFKRKFKYTNEVRRRRLNFYRKYHRSRFIQIATKKLRFFKRTRRYRKIKRKIDNYKYKGKQFRHVVSDRLRMNHVEKPLLRHKVFLELKKELYLVKTATWLYNLLFWLTLRIQNRGTFKQKLSKEYMIDGFQNGILLKDIYVYSKLMNNNLSIRLYNNFAPYYQSLIYALNNTKAVANNYKYIKQNGIFYKKFIKSELVEKQNKALLLNNSNSIYNNYDFEGITAYLNNYIIRHTFVTFGNTKYNNIPSTPVDKRIANYKYLYKAAYSTPYTTRITSAVSFYTAGKVFKSRASYVKQRTKEINSTATREFNIRFQFKQVYLYFFFKWYNKNIFNHSLSILYNSFFAVRKERSTLKQKIILFFATNRVSTLIYKKTAINIFLTLRGFNGKTQYTLSSGQIRMYGKRKIAPFTVQKLSRVFLIRIRKLMSEKHINFFRIVITGSLLNLWQFFKIMLNRTKLKNRDRAPVYSCYLFYTSYVGYIKNRIAEYKKKYKIDLNYYINLINYLYIILEYMTAKPTNMKFSRFHILYIQVKKSYSFLK